MANTNSNIVANRFTSPITASAVGQSGGRLRVVGGNFEIAAADIDADNDTVRLAILPANARVWHIGFAGDDLDASSDLVWNIGLYEVGTASTGPGSLVVTAASDGEVLFASAIAQQAVVKFQDNGNLISEDWVDGDAKIALFGQRLWELAEDSEGDFKEYEIVMTVNATAASAAAGTFAFMIYYTID